jgi:hypothetical protein
MPFSLGTSLVAQSKLSQIKIFLKITMSIIKINFQINGESKLRTAYNDKNNDLQIWLISFFGLYFITPDDVEDAFVELISVCPNISVGLLFSDYVLETYIEPGCLFPPILWAETPSSNPR